MGRARRRGWRGAGPGAALGLALVLNPPSLAREYQETGPPPAAAETAPATPAHAAAAPAMTAGVRVLPTGGLGMEAAALLLSGQQGGMLPIAVAAGPVGLADGLARVVVVVEIAGAPLLEDRPSSPLYLEVCLYALGSSASAGAEAAGPAPAEPAIAASAGREVLASVLETVELDLDRLGDRLAEGGIRILRELRLPAGEVSLRVLVRDPVDGKVGLRVVPLQVPAAGSMAHALMAPLLAGQEDRWLLLATPAAADSWGEGAPAALPLLSVGTPAAFRLLAGSGIEPSTLRVQLRPAEGAEPRELPVAVLASQPVPGTGLDRLSLSFTPPADVVAGSAVFRVTAGPATSAESAVVLVEGATPAAGWTALVEAAPVAVTTAGSGMPARSPGSARRPLRGYAASFRAVLQQLAGEGPVATAAALAELESRLLQETGAAKTDLADAELEVLAGLRRADPRALLPVLSLYLEVFRRARAQGSSPLSEHASAMVFESSALLADGDVPEARALAAGALLAFVDAALPWEPRPVISRALQRAADYQPEGQTTLLLAAMDAEARADHVTAIARLDDLRRVAPELPEAQLRLAVNHARKGDRRQAARLLGRLIATPAVTRPPPPWWLPVAFQELARLHVAAGRAAEAERVLRVGLAHVPGEEKLTLQLALLLAADGQRAAARGVLGELVPAAADRGFDSARHRYVELPREVLRGASAELRGRAEEQRARLGAALAATAASPATEGR
jgi:hypothetical protein